MKQGLLIAIIALLMGCSNSDDSKSITDVAWFGEVHEITLSDGTKCAIYRDYEKGGISCGWKNKE